jgi:hypothetical protein
MGYTFQLQNNAPYDIQAQLTVTEVFGQYGWYTIKPGDTEEWNRDHESEFLTIRAHGKPQYITKGKNCLDYQRMFHIGVYGKYVFPDPTTHETPEEANERWRRLHPSSGMAVVTASHIHKKDRRWARHPPSKTLGNVGSEIHILKYFAVDLCEW